MVFLGTPNASDQCSQNCRGFPFRVGGKEQEEEEGEGEGGREVRLSPHMVFSRGYFLPRKAVEPCNQVARTFHLLNTNITWKLI